MSDVEARALAAVDLELVGTEFLDAQILAGLAGDETVIVYPGESVDDDVKVLATRRAR